MPSAGVAGRSKFLSSPNWPTACVVLIVLAGAAFRLTAYGDVRASVGTMDTTSYMDHAGALRFSTTAFTGERLLTTGLLYRLWRAEDCPLEFVSIPAIGKEAVPGIQACFAGIAATQTILSIVGWSVLIASFASALSHGFSKLVGAGIVSLFAFSPQLADWDSILSSESLAFSLFAAWLGLTLLLIADRPSEGPLRRNSAWTMVLSCLGVLVAFLWILVRDAHVYVAIVLLVLALIYGIARRPWNRKLVIFASAAVVGCLLALGASQASGRWRIPLANAFEEYILPHPSRVSALQSLGMPMPGSESYSDWFAHRAPGSYAVFLATHPGFVTTTLFERQGMLFGENNQPYFKTPGSPLRNAVLGVGDLLHAKTPAVVVIDLIVVGALLIVGARSRSTATWPMSLMMAGLLASASLTLVLTFFGDAIGIERHVILSILMFRLLSWLGIIMIVDLALTRMPAPTNA